MFEVHVADNFHYMDESETHTHGQFATWPEAVAAARYIVDRCLAEDHRDGMTSDELYTRYTMFGDDPYIHPVPDGEGFSAWAYAKQRCAELCQPKEKDTENDSQCIQSGVGGLDNPKGTAALALSKADPALLMQALRRGHDAANALESTEPKLIWPEPSHAPSRRKVYAPSGESHRQAFEGSKSFVEKCQAVARQLLPLVGFLLICAAVAWLTTGRPLSCDRQCNAGYEWAMDHEIDDDNMCMGSKSFVKGCQAAAQGRAEYHRDQEGPGAGQDGW
jgi:hypothetical protein